MPVARTLGPVLAAAAGIATYSLMDAAMKGAVLALGALAAVFWRNAIGLVLTGALWAAGERRAPSGAALRLHLLRGSVVAAMSVLFFFGLGRLPIAEAIALSFVAPVLALGLAALLLGERVARAAWAASALAAVGVAVILGGKLGRGRLDEAAALGAVAVLGSAALYAWNLILARRQAQAAGPVEIAFVQTAVVTALLGVAALLGGVPAPWAAGWLLGAAAVLATVSLLALSWAYARAEAQALIPTEYTGFVWASVTGWLFFDERLTGTTVAGAALIVGAAWWASRAGAGVRLQPAGVVVDDLTSDARPG